jgi:T5orf172 domain
VKLKRPSFQFYPGDWLRATELRACSVGARGLWVDMICYMHEGTPYGHLKVNNKMITPENLGRMVGANPEEVNGWLDELAQAGVFSRDAEGCVYSRRMVRDEATRDLRAAGGKEGGNPKLIGDYNEPGCIYVARRSSDGHVKIGISKHPAKRIYKIRQQYPDDEVILIAQAAVLDMGKTERELHEKYAEFKSGEWFSLSEEDREGLVHLVIHLKEKPKVFQTPASASASASALKETPIAPNEKISFDASSRDFTGITHQTFEVWTRAYPAINLNVEMAKAAAWLHANPKNRKSNYAKFLSNWFSRAQDKAPRVGGSSNEPRSYD